MSQSIGLDSVIDILMHPSVLLNADHEYSCEVKRDVSTSSNEWFVLLCPCRREAAESEGDQSEAEPTRRRHASRKAAGK